MRDEALLGLPAAARTTYAHYADDGEHTGSGGAQDDTQPVGIGAGLVGAQLWRFVREHRICNSHSERILKLDSAHLELKWPGERGKSAKNATK